MSSQQLALFLGPDTPCDRPQLFKSEMVRAIADGSKRQTRRLSTRCRKGDRLWVRETWRICQWDEDFTQMTVQYRADDSLRSLSADQLWPNDDYDDRAHEVWRQLSDECLNAETPPSPDDLLPTKWRPSIFMPKVLTRYWLAVADVRQEYLQDISDADAIAEGITLDGDRSPREIFAELWDGINAKRGYAWEENPLIWVIEFTL